MELYFACSCGRNFATAEELHAHRNQSRCQGFEVLQRVIDLPHSSLLEQLGRWEVQRLLRKHTG